MLESLLAGLQAVFSWPAILFVIGGVLVGMLFGALPGLGSPVLLALLIPFTFGMDEMNAMVLFGAAMAGGAFAGSISAILVNIPGASPNAATLFDGYPMSQQGRGGEALGISATASALGAVFGIFILIAAIPVAREIILAFRPAEFFWLAILGLTVIAVASEGTLLKGLVSGGIGLLLSLVGFSVLTAEYRYGFGTQYFWDGIELIPALIGLFAIAEVINLTRKGGSISTTDVAGETTGVWKGVRYVLTKPFLFARSASIGTLVGMVPGVGGVVPPFLAYMQAMQTSNEPERFGTGMPDGVLATEAANDAKDGGALLPTIAFGIPGSATMVVLLGALTIHGLNPGRELLVDELHITFTIIMALLVGNVLTSSIGIVFTNQLVKITFIPAKLLVPPILVISLVGTFALRNQIYDVWLAIAFGILGYGLVVFDYSRVAVVIALVLGALAERSFHQAISISGGDPSIFFVRPISFVLFVLTLFSLSLPIRQARKRRRETMTRGSD